MRYGSQCPFEIFHLPHSGRRSQQLLLSRTDYCGNATLGHKGCILVPKALKINFCHPMGASHFHTFCLFKNIRKPAEEKVEYSEIIPIPLASKSGGTGDTPIFKIEDTSEQRSCLTQKSSENEINGFVQVRLLIDCVALAKQGDNRIGSVRLSVCLSVRLSVRLCSPG